VKGFRSRFADFSSLRWVATVAFAVAGWTLVQDTRGILATKWMKLYDPKDFHDLADVLAFFQQLHTGVSPVLSLFEILSQLWLGDTTLVTEWVFRFGIVLVYMLPFLAFSRTKIEFFLSYAISLVFLWATVVLAAIALQIYDVLLPLFVMLCLTFVKLASARERPPALSLTFCVLGGLFLSMAELSRPFMLFILPFILVHAYQALKPLPKRCFVGFLVPLAILSGGWHLKLLLVHDGQLIWSNSSGLNLWKGWKRTVPDWPEFTTEKWVAEQAEEGAFQGSGRYEFLNWNSEAHSKKSRELTRAVISYSIRHPIDAGRHVLEEMLELLRPKTNMFGKRPDDGILTVYRPLVRITAAFMFLNGVCLGFLLLRHRDLAILAIPDSAIIITGCLSTFFLAVGERGEEARFVVSLLPFLAVLPRVLSLSVRRTEGVLRVRATYYTTLIPEHSGERGNAE
jgi:hypothetical protein